MEPSVSCNESLEALGVYSLTSLAAHSPQSPSRNGGMSLQRRVLGYRGWGGGRANMVQHSHPSLHEEYVRQLWWHSTGLVNS